jgi:hypothetical protein
MGPTNYIPAIRRYEKFKQSAKNSLEFAGENPFSVKLEDCKILGASENGVAVKAGGVLECLRTQVDAATLNGVDIALGAKLFMEGCTVSNSLKAGVVVKSGLEGGHILNSTFAGNYQGISLSNPDTKFDYIKGCTYTRRYHTLVNIKQF